MDVLDLLPHHFFRFDHLRMASFLPQLTSLVDLVTECASFPELPAANGTVPRGSASMQTAWRSQPAWVFRSRPGNPRSQPQFDRRTEADGAWHDSLEYIHSIPLRRGYVDDPVHWLVLDGPVLCRPKRLDRRMYRLAAKVDGEGRGGASKTLRSQAGAWERENLMRDRFDRLDPHPRKCLEVVGLVKQRLTPTASVEQ